MPRRREVPKRPVMPDPKYGDRLVTKFMNIIMLNGKKGMISLTLIYMSDQDFRDAFTYVRETFAF